MITIYDTAHVGSHRLTAHLAVLKAQGKDGKVKEMA
jgi:hypothetical protein